MGATLDPGVAELKDSPGLGGINSSPKGPVEGLWNPNDLSPTQDASLLVRLRCSHDLGLQ